MDRLMARHASRGTVCTLLHLESKSTHTRKVALDKLPALVLGLGTVML